MRTDGKTYLPLIVFVVIAGIVFLLTQQQTPLFQKPLLSPTQSTEVEVFSVKQTIMYSTDKKEQSSVEVKNGESVLEVLSKSKNIKTKTYSYGTLVEDIEGIKNGTNQKYWLYYINGEEAKVGAADYKVKPNDSIEWKFKAYEEQ